MALIDLHTVDTLQLYAPQASKVDRKTVKGKILGGEVFSNFSQSKRATIWENLQSHEACDGIIPSLHTFFRDISYLELCANAVKRLVVLNKQYPTVRCALVHSFQPHSADSDCLIQTSETTFRRQFGSNDERIMSGYRQIWIYAMRHYPDMAKDVQGGQKANPTRAKARARADESVVHDMASLSRKLGFHTPQIKAILKQSPDRQIAQAALLKARKPDHYHYDSETFESLIEQIAGCFALAVPNNAPSAALITGRAIKLKDRCGAPQEQTQQLDRPHIFLDQLHSATVLRRNLSSLEARRSVYYAFFGKLSSQTTMQSTSSEQPSADEPLSPLFVPNDDSRLGPGSTAENMTERDFSEEPSNRRRQWSGRREDSQRRKQAAVHTSFPPVALSLRGSSSEGPPVSEGMSIDTWESSDSEDLGRGMQESELSPATNEGTGAEMDTQECTEIDEDELDRGMGEGGNQEDLAGGGQERIEQGRLAREREAEEEPGKVMELEHIAREDEERTECERLQREAEQECLAREEQLERERQRLEAQGHAFRSQQEAGEILATAQTSPADNLETIEEEPAIHNKEAAEEIEGLLHEMLQGNAESGTASQDTGIQERVIQERADALAQLQSNVETIPSSQGTIGGHGVSRPVTELPIDRLNLIAQWREQRSQRVDENALQSRPSRLRTNRAGTWDATTADEPWETDEDGSCNASQAADSHGIVPEIAVRPVAEQVGTSGEQPQKLTEGTAEDQVLQNPDIAINSGTQPHEELVTGPTEVEPPQDISREEPVLAGTNTGTEEAASQSPETQVGKATLNRHKRHWRNPQWVPYDSSQKGNRKGAIGQRRRAREAEEQLAGEVVEQERLAEGAKERAEYETAGHVQHERLAREEQLESEQRRREVEEWHGSQLDDENLPRSWHQRSGTKSQPHKPEGVRKLQMKNRLTHRNINRAGTLDAAVADELWGSDDDGGTTADATELGPSQQDTERYAADLSDPEQAQQEAIARQEAEDLLFDTPHTLEEIEDQEMEDVQEKQTPEVDAAPNNKVARQSKKAKQKRTGQSGLSKALEAGLSRDSPPGQRITITFHVYERGGWKRTDMVSVRSENPVEAQVIADRHAQDLDQNARFYDCGLRKVAVNECVRAAIDDGSFTVLMSFGRDLVVTRHIVASAAQLLENVGSDRQDQAAPGVLPPVIAPCISAAGNKVCNELEGEHFPMAQIEPPPAVSLEEVTVLDPEPANLPPGAERPLADLTSRQDHPGKRFKASTGAPSAGPVQRREDQESRAAKVATRLDGAPTATTAMTQSETERPSRRILMPRIVERPAQDVQPSRAAVNSQPVMIVFRARENNGHWKTAHEVVVVDWSDPSEVERVARKEARNRQATFYDKNLRKLTPAQCFEAAIADETNTIFMQSGGELMIDEDTMRSIARELEL